MLASAHDAVQFRHELVRLIVEESVSPDRRLRLHRAALTALADPRSGRAGSRQAGAPCGGRRRLGAVLRFGPAAAGAPQRSARTGRRPRTMPVFSLRARAAADCARGAADAPLA